MRNPTEEHVLIAHGSELSQKPLADWQRSINRAANQIPKRLSFMTPEHHAVRNFSVTGLMRSGRPLVLAEIAAHVGLPTPRLLPILEELERNLFFLVRNSAGEVAWAFPVTADRTPHQMQFSTGERIFGACAEDSFAAPFVLGRLLDRRLSVEIHSVCGQSGHPLRLTVASDLRWSAHAGDVQHLLFVPSVDWEAFRSPNIIDDY
jgi:hypothetical protein